MSDADPQRPRAVGRVDGEVVCVSASWSTVELRTENGDLILRASPAPEHAFRIHDARFVCDRYLVCGVGTGIMSGGVWALDVREQTWAPPVLERWSDVGVLAACGVTPSVLFGDGADIVRWDLERREETARIHGPDVYAGALAPDGGHIALAGPRGLGIWAGEGEPQRRTDWVGAEPTAMTYVGEDALLTAAFEGELRLYDLDLAPRAKTRLDVREVDSLSVSPDGTRVACCGGGLMHLLDATTLELVSAPREASAARFVEGDCVVLGRRGARRIHA